MGMTSRLDAGPLYAQKSIPIEPSDTGGSLMEKLADLARDLLLEQADALVAGTLKGVPQDESQATLAPSLEKEDGRVRWNQTAEEIDRQVRAMTPWPAAYTLCPTDRSPSRLILVSGSVVDIPSPAMPGTVVAFTSGIEVATKKGVYRLIEVKRSGKRALSAVEFLRGFPIPVGTRLQ
jgi:methionyl-tRNA formyltransferase